MVQPDGMDRALRAVSTDRAGWGLEVSMARSPFVKTEEEEVRGDDSVACHGTLDQGISEQILVLAVS